MREGMRKRQEKDPIFLLSLSVCERERRAVHLTSCSAQWILHCGACSKAPVVRHKRGLFNVGVSVVFHTHTHEHHCSLVDLVAQPHVICNDESSFRSHTATWFAVIMPMYSEYSS